MSDFRNSKTKDNLMRAFAGESQARNRYTMAEEKARQQKLYVLADQIHSRSGESSRKDILRASQRAVRRERVC